MLSQCFSLSGEPNNDEPCDKNSIISACCPKNTKCITNLYCLSDINEKIIGSCTESDWKVTIPVECPCSNNILNDNMFDSTQNITMCINDIYCCGQNNFPCCDKGLGRLSIVYDDHSATILEISNTISIASTVNSQSTLDVGNSIENIPVVSSSISTKSVNLSFTTTTLSSDLAITSNSLTKNENGNNNSSFSQIGIGIALGLGTPLLLILGACIFLFIRLRETRLKSLNEQENPILKAKRSLNTLRTKRSIGTLDDLENTNTRWI